MKPIDVQVNVKPVFVQLIHSGPYEGPCRVGTEQSLSPEAESSEGRTRFEGYVRELRDNLAPYVRLLEPVYMEWGDDFVLPEAEIAKLEPDVHDADLILMARTGLPQYPAISIGHRYGKPVGMMGWVASIDIAAHLRSRGLEGYAFLDYEDLNHSLALMRARKAFRRTRILVAAEGNATVPTGVVSSIWDLDGLKMRYGVDHTFVSAMDLIQGVDALGEEEHKQAGRIATALVTSADAVHMDSEDVLRSVEFYMAVKKALARYEANAFVIPCFELCAKQILERRRFTFCLAHSLLKDEGIPSACEADTNVLMAIALLTYLARKSAYMGNSSLIDRDRNILGVHHDVPGLKMKGLDGPDLPYEIRNFTVGGWGATLRYDFSRDVGAPVTLARFNPAGTKVLAVRGELAGGGGFSQVGCSLSAQIKVADIVDLHRKEMDFGHHLAMVYGDCVEDIKQLGSMMGYETVES